MRYNLQMQVNLLYNKKSPHVHESFREGEKQNYCQVFLSSLFTFVFFLLYFVFPCVFYLFIFVPSKLIAEI